ncbi:MAG TPA: glycosyltransferase [Vicinamibacterales bacterium]|nr:glycosyltransferase [Vicinamibacterales bacterium]
MTSGSPFISVIIASANQGHRLGEAIASVWRSTRRDVEIVVVDEGSTDDTATVAKSFGGVTYVSLRGRGRAKARNRGLADSRGPAVVFLDADAQLAPGALDVGAAELDAHPLAAFVFGRCRSPEGNGSAPGRRERPRLDRDYYRELLTRNYIGRTCAVMFRRTALERAGGFDASVEAAADYGLYLRIARMNRIHDHGQLVAVAPESHHAGYGPAGTLQDTLTVLRRERPLIEADPWLFEAYQEGWRHARDFYGARIAGELHAHLQAHEWIGAVRSTLQLGWLHPRAIGQHGARRLAASVHGLVPRSRRIQS